MDCKKLTHILPSGKAMPLIGFGTFQIKGKSLIRDVINWALEAGYRQFDTAAVYNNEQDIGAALKELLPQYNLKREDIFITTKLSPSDQGPNANKALENSIRNLDCGYIDLYLIHWPGAHGLPAHNPQNAAFRAESWKSLVQAHKTGIVKDLGVSNYTVKHLTELLKDCGGVPPAVNQVEWHPACHQGSLKDFCRKNNILLEAYSSLGGTNNPNLIKDSIVTSIAAKLQKSPSQVLLRWALQQNIAIIPKARSKEHIANNIDLNFEIPDGDMIQLDNMKQSRFAWDPNVVA